jgi:hypothetical protein
LLTAAAGSNRDDEVKKATDLKTNCKLSVLLLFFALQGPDSFAQTKHVRLENSSDWWSYLRLEELPPNGSNEKVTFQNRVPAESNFQIGELTIGLTDIQQIRNKLGDATEIERGDAASGRRQICYASPSGSIHLIFEWGEVDSVLYLFEGGPEWDGMNFCTQSPAVSKQVTTSSGLTIALSPEQVKTILGAPNIDTPDKQVYYFGYRTKTSAEGLVRLRKDNPNMNEQNFHQNFDYIDVEAYVEARFASGKLNYLAISRSETY